MVIHVDDKLQTNLVVKMANKHGLKSKKTRISWSGKDGVVVSGDANKLKKFMSAVEKMDEETVSEKFKPYMPKGYERVTDLYVQFRGDEKQSKKDFEQAKKIVSAYSKKHKLDIKDNPRNRVFGSPEEGSRAYKVSIFAKFTKDENHDLAPLYTELSKLKTAEDHGGGNAKPITENYRTLARKGMGTETPKSIKVGTEIDYYEPKLGDKKMGKVVKMDRQTYSVKDDKTGKVHKFFYHDRMKAAKLLKQGDNMLPKIKISMKEETLQEGTWEVPDSYPKLVKLNKFLSKSANFKDAQSVHRWHVQADAFFGDDSFSDDIDAYKTTLKGGENDFYDRGSVHSKEYLDRMKKYNKIKVGTDLRDVLEKELTDWTGGVLKFKNHEIVQMPRDWYMKDNPNEKDDKSPVKAKLESVDYHTDVIVENFKRGKGRLKFKKSPPIKVEGNAVSRAQQAAIAIAKKKKNESIMDAYREMWEENLNEEMIVYKVKGMQKPEEQKFKVASRMGLKVSFKKSGSDTHVTLTGTKKNLRDFDAVARGKSSYGDPSTIKHFDEK